MYNMKYWIVLLFTSYAIFVVSKIYNYTTEYYASSKTDDVTDKFLSHISNTFGIVSILSINYLFIIPISSRHGSIMTILMKWNNIECIHTLHIYFGYAFTTCGLIHG